MNMVLETIKSRRSVRKFTNESVDEAVLEQIIEAGLFAPSSHNQQPWHLSVITNKALIDEMSVFGKGVARGLENEFLNKIGNNPDYHIFFNAPVLMVVSGDESAMNPKVDTAVLGQNILLATEALGLGACWVGMLRLCLVEGGEHLVSQFQVPEGYQPYFAIAIGHKAVATQNAPARKPNKVTYIK